MQNFEKINNDLLRGVFATLRWAGREATRSEIEEYHQAAWLRYLEMPEEQSSPFLCGKRATAASIRSWSRRQGTNETRSNDALGGDVLHREMRPPMPVEMRHALLDEFQAQRNKGGNRGLFAAARDVAILNLLWQGYGDKEICAQLDMPYLSLRTYRKQIKVRLQKMLAHQTKESFNHESTIN